MATGNVGTAEIKRLVWGGYWRGVETLWRLKWPIVGLVAIIVTIMFFKH